MPNQAQKEAAGAAGKKAKKPPATLRPSSSVMLLSPTNQALLLARVHTSSSFASAHVFPGGNLSSFHDGSLPASDSPAFHEDGPAYRLAAIRETFEESGILLARKLGQSRDQGLLHVPDDVREAGRRQVHGNQVKFTEWLKNLGGEPDVENLIPFTRWITPHGPPKRFTTQMYLYMLPLPSQCPPTSDLLLQTSQTIIPTPTHDGGVEHTAATFDDARAWLAKARAGEIILFPPQFYLLHLAADFLQPLPTSSTESTTEGQDQQEQQQQQQLSPSEQEEQTHRTRRTALLTFLARTPTSTSPHLTPATGDKPAAAAAAVACSAIPWSRKVMSPALMFVRRQDGRVVLGLDKPGSELEGSGRGGDWERVVLVSFRKEGPRDVEVRGRGEVLGEEREGEGEDAKL